MKNRTFYILLGIIFFIGTGITVGLMIYGYNLWKTISIVELISNWK